MELLQRKLPRLSGFDYSLRNYYYVTFCTYQKSFLFGSPEKLNEFGRIVKKEIEKINEHFQDVSVDKYVVMPNHVHAIFKVGYHQNSTDEGFTNLSTAVGLLKSGISRKIHKIDPDIKVWQKSFYDRIIRNELEYHRAWNYIEENPQKWNGVADN